ncbi:hypothetical protein V6N13_089148 [Hibiscus sabdariffa]|uniref:Reverse transcriptase zinc-binding domain-containing protein n=2 Tax=Hibiscus sabdariffa TaxID=183260 RepID=A0ABR1ZYI2_9ROSI
MDDQCSRLWMGLVPFNIECFGWRLLLGQLPTKVELSKRGMLFNDQNKCVLCKGEEEPTSHMFFSCSVSWQVFDLALTRVGWWIHAKWLENGCLVNKFVANPNLWTLPPKLGVDNNSVEWSVPLEGLVKFNIDGPVAGSFSMARIGGILRNHKGEVMAEFSKSIGRCNPASAEVQSCFSRVGSGKRSTFNVY